MLEVTYASPYNVDGPDTGGYCFVRNRTFFEN